MTAIRKKITVGFGLAAVVLAIVVPPLVALSVRPYEPPLRVGMNWRDVEQAIGKWDSSASTNPISRRIEYRDYGPDWIGRRQKIAVVYEKEKVIDWEVTSASSTRPLWLDTAMKWVGW